MNENADEFRPWKECKRSFGNLFTVKVIGTLLEHNMSCSIVWKWKVLHVPTHKNKNHLIIMHPFHFGKTEPGKSQTTLGHVRFAIMQT